MYVHPSSESPPRPLQLTFVPYLLLLQVVRLREVFPHGQGFVLVFDFMLSDLAAVVRNSESPLTEVAVGGS